MLTITYSEVAIDEQSPMPLMQISATFHPDAALLDSPPDTLILSSDSIFFAVHYNVLSTASNNSFAGLLTASKDAPSNNRASLLLAESSDLLTIALLSLYNIPCTMYNFSYHSLTSSFPVFTRYGLTPLHKYITPGKPLYDAILHYAPLHPINTYVLAAAARLEDLAVASSAYTLAIPLHTIPQHLLDLMGTSYMGRLYRLHGMRMDALRSDLEVAIYPHTAKSYCSADKRREVYQRYQETCAQIYFKASSGESTWRMLPHGDRLLTDSDTCICRSWVSVSDDDGAHRGVYE